MGWYFMSNRETSLLRIKDDFWQIRETNCYFMFYIHIGKTYDGLRRVPRLRRASQSPQKTPHRSSHPTEKQTPTLSLRVLSGLRTIWSNKYPTQNSQRVGRGLFFSGMCGYVWGLPRRRRGLYVIPRPGVPRHIQGDAMIIKQLWSKCRLYTLSFKQVQLESWENMHLESPHSVLFHDVFRSFLCYFVDLES